MTKTDDDVTALEVFLKAISGDPKFVEAKKSGSAFVIAPTKPRAKNDQDDAKNS